MDRIFLHRRDEKLIYHMCPFVEQCIRTCTAKQRQPATNAAAARAIEIAQISEQDIANYQSQGKNGQQFVVRSNRKFNISVQQLASASVGKSISVSVAQNNTGGAVASGTQKLTGANQQLIANANLGEQSFAVNYNAGSLRENVGVVYTATNP